MKPILFLTLAVSLQAADFPTPYNTERSTEPLMPAGQAARGMAMPDGFRCSVFASEPDVQNPIAMAWDSKGRMWVAENYTYAGGAQRFDLGLRDRVIILDRKSTRLNSSHTVISYAVFCLKKKKKKRKHKNTELH